MHRPIRPNESLRRARLPLLLALLVLLLALGYLLSPYSPLRMCTQMGCRDSLEVSLLEEPPQDYTLVLVSDSGETRGVTCAAGKEAAYTSDTYPATTVCQSGRITFYGFSPSAVRVEITWQGGSFSSSGQPKYEPFRPNGRFCQPVCKAGTLVLQLP